VNIPPEELQYGFDVAGLDPQALGEAVQAVINESMNDPMNATMWMSQMALAQQTAGLNLLRRLNAGTEAETSAATKDKRFADPAWKRNPFFLGFAETYLDQAKVAMAMVESSHLPEATRRKAKFGMQLMCDAFAPSNVPWLNPAVLREAMETGGMSLVRGMQNFADDLRDNDGMPRQVDATPFKLGVNMGATPGRIVFRNALIELIAYEPQTAQVHEIPLLCSPPWINKYYVMDLAPGRSFIEWAVLHGHQTFAISYRNPDASMAALRMEDYLRDGILTALEVVEKITGRRRTNIAALCLGGTMAALAMAYLAARGEGDRIASATLTNTLVDFSEPGELGVFTDESSIARLEKSMQERGYLESTEMAGTFNWMRANDLVWSYVVNNWFQGKNPPAFDILAWNADSTRMPAAMHSQYLRACYLGNLLMQPGAFSIAGAQIDLGAIANPLYVVGAETDHIAPWRSAYRTIQLVGSDDVRFTLTNSGHIAGIVNPPGSAKSEHWTLDDPGHDRTADEWRAAAIRHAGTWWEDWAIWAGAHAGPLVEPAKLPPGEAAPGAYVRNETAVLYDPFARKTPARKRAPRKRKPA
jgi:polyhydroxyalkanoate synthase